MAHLRRRRDRLRGVAPGWRSGRLGPWPVSILRCASCSRRHFISLSTLLSDGAPHPTNVWVAVEDGRPCFFTQPNTLKARNIDSDRRVAITVVDRENPYRSGQLRARVTETVEGDAALEIIDRMARKYTGADFPMRSGVVYLIDVSSSFLSELPFNDAPG